MSASCGIYEALWLARLHQRPVGALYVHLPFCRQKCAYCDFSSWATAAGDPLIHAYVEALESQVGELREVGLLEGCRTAYVGGGTPTLAGERLVGLVRRICEAAPTIAELTCEANPDSLDDLLLGRLRGAGCTRLSIGVQSLEDGELRALGRIHTAAQATERVAAAVRAGYDVSCDLMCAIPGQTDESWRRSVAGAVSCGVGHVSVYPLQIEENTPLGLLVGDDEPAWNDPEVQARRMELARDLLSDAGFARYEVASYARSGRRCAHNWAYWTAVPYVGLGCGASSMLAREGYDALRDVAPQLPEVPVDVRRVRLCCTSSRQEIARRPALHRLSFDIELLDEGQAAAEDLMLAMRTVEGIGWGPLAHARAVLGAGRVDDALAWCAHRGLVSHTDRGWAPTDEGWLLGNELYGRLWDLAGGDVRSLSVSGRP